MDDGGQAHNACLTNQALILPATTSPDTMTDQA